jgi:hypothetical protein
MQEDSPLEQIRKDAEASQRAINWPDILRAQTHTFVFLWKGDPKAKRVQRAGLVVFAIWMFIPAIVIVAEIFEADFSGPKIWALTASSAMFIVGLRFLRNAFLRAPKEDDQNKPG